MANNAHISGQTQSLSGVPRDMSNPNADNGVSIDQYIAQQLNAPQPVTPEAVSRVLGAL